MSYTYFDFFFFLSAAILKNQVLKMAATVMIVKFGSAVCAVLWTDTNIKG